MQLDHYISLVVFLLCSYKTKGYPATCYYTTSMSKFLACPRLDPTDLGRLTNLRQICRHLECTIQCFEDAIGHCANTGFFRAVDVKTAKTMWRYACHDPEGTVKMVEACNAQLLDNECVTDKLKQVFDAKLQFRLSPLNVDDYVSDMCSAVRDYRRCATQPPIQPTWKCSTAEAAMANNFLDLDTSMSGCGQAHTNTLFSVYGGPTQCRKESSATSLI